MHPSTTVKKGMIISLKATKIVKKAGIGFLSLSLCIGSLLISNGSNQTYAKEMNPSALHQMKKPKSSAKKITNEDQSIILTQLKNNVWVHTSYNEWDGTLVDHNGLIVSTSKGIVLIDTAWDSVDNQDKTKELLKMIKKHFKKKVVLAIVTHAHDDSIGGIQALLDEGIDVRSTKLTAKLAKKYGYPSPNPTLDKQPKLKVGNTIIETYYPGEGHSKDNITVWLPQTKTLFGGCFVKSLESTDLGNIADANVDQWDDSVKKVIRKYPKVKNVIPGHGQWGNKRLLHHTLKLIQEHNQNQ